MVELSYIWNYPVLKRKVGRPQTRTMPRKEYQRAHYYRKRYGTLERMNPEFVKPKQVRNRFPEVEIEFYHMAALTEFDLMPSQGMINPSIG